MTELSRRQFLQSLAAAYGAAVMGCRRKGDPFAQECVCIHIFHPAEFIPAPLLEGAARPPVRDAAMEYFGINLPELVICTTRTAFLDMFQYFWPFSRDDFARLEESIQILHVQPTINGTPDISASATYMREHADELTRAKGSSAVMFTFNEFTRHWTPDVIAACREAKIREFVLFKDPTRSPYLCTYPALQKGFKRPPP